jgi:hypothetical protein
MMLFDPRWVQASNGGIMLQGEEVQHSRETKLKESEYEEGHITLRVK